MKYLITLVILIIGGTVFAAEKNEKEKHPTAGFGPIETYMYAKVKLLQGDFSGFWDITHPKKRKKFAEQRGTDKFKKKLVSLGLKEEKFKDMTDKELFVAMCDKDAFKDLKRMKTEVLTSITVEIDGEKAKVKMKRKKGSSGSTFLYDKASKCWFK